MKYNTGGVINEPGSSKKNKTGGWRTRKPIILREKCIKCGKCWVFCPDNAIKIRNGAPVIDYDYCKGCLICVQQCPVRAIIVEEEEK